MEQETFFTLLKDAAHWEFEILVTLIVDGLILGLLWPFISKHLRHHFMSDELHGFTDRKKTKKNKGRK